MPKMDGVLIRTKEIGDWPYSNNGLIGEMLGRDANNRLIQTTPYNADFTSILDMIAQVFYGVCGKQRLTQYKKQREQQSLPTLCWIAGFEALRVYRHTEPKQGSWLMSSIPADRPMNRELIGKG